MLRTRPVKFYAHRGQAQRFRICAVQYIFKAQAVRQHGAGIVQAAVYKAQQAAAKGKKLGKTDQQFMKRAEELLYEELSLALDMPKDQVKDHILQTLEPAAQ